MSFGTCGNLCFSNLAIGINTDGNGNIVRITLYGNGSNVTEKLTVIVGYLVHRGNAVRRIFRYVRILVNTVKHVSEGVVYLLRLCSLYDGCGKHINHAEKCRNHNAYGCEHRNGHYILFRHFFLPPNALGAVHFSM